MVVGSGGGAGGWGVGGWRRVGGGDAAGAKGLSPTPNVAQDVVRELLAGNASVGLPSYDGEVSPERPTWTDLDLD